MKARFAFLTVLAVLFTISSQMEAQAGERFGMKRQFEVGGTIGYQSITPVANGVTGNSTGVFTIAPYVGFFPIDGFELGLLSSVTIITPSGGNSASGARIFLAPSYNIHIADSMVTPFIEGLAGLATSSSGNVTQSGFSFGGRAGLKVNVTGKGLLLLDVRYLMITEKPNGVPNRYGTNELSLNIGFTVWFN